jgi:glyoxylase-like metal-dependent hydrolase (beta-lactamase superfamily II)
VNATLAALIDPENSQIDRWLALAARSGLRIRYAIDTHSHADHFSATRRRLCARFALNYAY